MDLKNCYDTEYHSARHGSLIADSQCLGSPWTGIRWAWR